MSETTKPVTPMKITVCYPSDSAPLDCRCRIYGFGAASDEPGPEWTEYAAFYLPDARRIAAALIDALGDALARFDEAEYRDEKFSSTVPESAECFTYLVSRVLARDEFRDIPYRSLTRQWNADFCTETVHRTVPASAIREP